MKKMDIRIGEDIWCIKLRRRDMGYVKWTAHEYKPNGKPAFFASYDGIVWQQDWGEKGTDAIKKAIADHIWKQQTYEINQANFMEDWKKL